MSIEKLAEVSAEIAASKAKLAAFARESGKRAIGAAFAMCFDPPTRLTRITWTQYTPHFNDGDTCVFGVHEPSLFYEDDDGELEIDAHVLSSEWDGYRERRERATNSIGQSALDAFNDTWDKLDSDILEAVFGDHCQVTITKDEVTVDEYDHD